MIADIVPSESVQVGDRVFMSGKTRTVERKHLRHGAIRFESGSLSRGNFWGAWCQPGDLIPVIRKEDQRG
jgi:hypothetical protein